MSNYLFTLTITPVQSFISQARKTKDLFVSSEILSNLMKEVIGSEVLTSHNTKVIYPVFLQDEDKSSFPNKLIVKIDNTTTKEIRDIAKKLEEFINNEFYQIGWDLLCDIMIKYKIFINTKFMMEHFKPQLCNFFQVFWVAVELKDNYQKSYKKLEQSLGAVKNLRTFRQLEQTSAKKCSVCGERNGLFYSGDKKTKSIIDNAIYIKDANQLKNSETLCAVCFVKRFYKEKEEYPSTAKIALSDWLNEIKDENKYKSFFKKSFDESLYFKENLSKEYLEKWGYYKDDKSIEDAKAFLDNLQIEIKQKKYYALLKFDIDDMGKTLSGLDKDKQIALSKKLGIFSQKIGSEVLTSQKGKTVYAGGDDFLGFVNLKYLFVAIKCLKRAFKKEVEKEFPDLTFSTSIVIAHYKAPLHKVLDFSRELLDESKSHFDDKNGVGLIVLSDSSINAKTICRYDDLSLLEDMRKDKIGMSLHYKLQTIFSYLDEMSYYEFLTQKQMIKVEIKRLLNREDGKLNHNIYNNLISFLDNQKIKLAPNNYKINFENFIGFLKTLEQLRKVM